MTPQTYKKMERILFGYGLSKETVISKMVLYKDTKVMVHQVDGDVDFYDIDTGLLKVDILAPFLFRIFQDFVERT